MKKKILLLLTIITCVAVVNMGVYTKALAQLPLEMLDEDDDEIIIDGGELPGATIICDTQGWGRCYKTGCENHYTPIPFFVMRLTYCYGSAPQTEVCISGIPCL